MADDNTFTKPIGMTIKYCSLLLYEKSDSYGGRTGKDIIDEIVKLSEEMKFNYSYIFHDDDYFEEDTFDSNKNLIGVKGEKKDNHYHVVIGFRYRIVLSDFALKLHIEDRFIEKLKKEIDYDNMLIYLTHIRSPNKHEYEFQSVHSNILDYNRYLYEKALEQLEDNKKNIINHCIDFIKSKKSKKIRYIDLYNYLVGMDIGINEYNKYYRIIKDLVIDHNQLIAIRDDNKAIRSRLKETQNLLTQAESNFKKSAEENMRLRGIDIEEEREEIF